MEMHQLEYVLAVAKYNNFTRAAEGIKISQSSLSQQINKLENELGTSLFLRTTRSVKITPAGAEFIEYAQRIISEVSEARRSIQEYVSKVKGELTLGTMASIENYNLPNLIKSFQDKFPDTKIHIVEEQYEELQSMLHLSKIDAAFTRITNPDPQFCFYPLIDDRMVVVVTDLHPLANRVSVDMKELENEKFILTPYDFRKDCHEAGFEPKVILSCAAVQTMMNFVREGIGIAVLSSREALSEKDSSMKVVELTPTIPRRIYLVTRKSDDMPPPLEIFLKFTTQWLDTQKSIERASFSIFNYLNTRDSRIKYKKKILDSRSCRNMKELFKA
jgi:LysR family transcriptional activator of glutamate synthase operon